ncbi:histone-like nucleoid-structuring protein Lsr2 [Streptomyces sp. NPDC004528]|uniref:Lsr2 family DNA-binding protein n=1 Tax=Streptomyces sp. NPDC004528 TaxID=3154550 RepID=UPI0033BA58D4
MTVAALLALLDEIDEQGGPKAARENRLTLTTPEGGVRPMTTAAPPPPDREQPLPVGQLLAWAQNHPDSDVQDQGERARAALAGLRQRYATDQELEAITTEAEQLEQRLFKLRTRKAELTPAKPKSRRKAVDYPSAVVRAWARENGVECPPVGRVPKAVVEAWEASNSRAAADV